MALLSYLLREIGGGGGQETVGIGTGFNGVKTLPRVYVNMQQHANRCHKKGDV